LTSLNTPVQETPYLVIDVRVAADRYRDLAESFGPTTIYYAVKANPEPSVIRTLVEQGSSFDVASPAEIDLALEAGAPVERLSYGNTIKKSADIAYAYARGVRMFAFDSEAELRKLAEHAPGSAVYCRLLVETEGAQWPLGKKFGCSAEMAVELLTMAPELGLDPLGVSFHVGSQMLDPAQWGPSIRRSAEIFRRCRAQGVELRLLNAGGGFPVGYADPVAPIESYAKAIHGYVEEHFAGSPAGLPATAIEPGRFIAAESGVLRAQVVLVSRKSHDDEKRWVYLDVGRFGGLAETEGEAIRYRITTPHGDAPAGPVILAGPTCDSVDILYQQTPYHLPLDLEPGDFVEILGTGAYTATYSSTRFNGFPPLTTICIGDNQ
jgi:ornithine decarboxylase